MNDTPRTEAARQGATGKRPYVPAYFARQLERELAEAQKDTARLDWLDQLCPKSHWRWKMVVQSDTAYLDKNQSGGLKTARQAIDAAMEEQNK